MSGSTELGAAIRLVKERLSADPTLIEELAPGMMLVRRPMTPTERAKRAVPAMNDARLRHQRIRQTMLREVVRDMIAQDPAISDDRIAEGLNLGSIKPPRGRAWLASDAKLIRKELDIAH